MHKGFVTSSVVRQNVIGTNVTTKVARTNFKTKARTNVVRTYVLKHIL